MNLSDLKRNAYMLRGSGRRELSRRTQGPRGKGQGALLPLPSRKRRLGRVIPPIKTPALFREQRGGFIFRCSAAPCRVVRPYGCEGKFQIVQAGR